MSDLRSIEQYCNQLLSAGEFDDYCPNGLQIESSDSPVKQIVSGVTASQALIDRAVELEADLLLVHHGFFWRGEKSPLTGIKGGRIRTLMQNSISMMAYHLPLDAHPELGNNKLLGNVLGYEKAQPLSVDNPLLWAANLVEPVSTAMLALQLQEALGQAPLLLPGGDHEINRLGWCTGAAQSMIEQASAAGLDAFISGEVSESTTHMARELGIHYLAAGHHVTERYGVQALGQHLTEHFALEHQFIDIPNPV